MLNYLSMKIQQNITIHGLSMVVSWTFRSGLINSTCTLSGTVHILRTVGERPIKVFHMSTVLELCPNFEFCNIDGDVSVDALVMLNLIKLLKFYNFFCWKILRLENIELVWLCSVCMFVSLYVKCIYAEVHTLMHTYGHHLEWQMVRSK